jgi:DNA-binding MarR family transcriptional regulator
MKSFLLKQKPVAVIICLKDSEQKWYPSKLAKYSATSYVYVTKWLSKLQQAGWVQFEKKGRMKTVSLSEQGRIIATALDDLVKKIDEKQKNHDLKTTQQKEEGTVR